MLTSRRREQLKLALALERHLPTTSPSAVWPPDFYWDRFQAAARRVNQVQRHQWKVALPLSLEELERVGESLVQQIRAVTELAKAPLNRMPKASLRDILMDLQALEDEFPEVRWDRRERTLSVLTEAVVLKGIDLGRFEILLEYGNLGRSRPYRVIAWDPNPAAGDETTTHPHLRDEDLCEGDGRAPLQKAIRQERFYDVFVLINQILNTYNKDSAYVPLSRWEGTTCESCRATISDDDTLTCEECHSEACTECCSSCSKCFRCLCDNCQDRCGSCGDTFCRNCLMACPGCSDDFCSSCIENGRCEDCPLEDDEETTDEEIEAEPVPAEPEVQSVCLGQAFVPEGSGTD